MLAEKWVRVNQNDVVHEAMDGEVVVVNLKNGRYYSLAGSGTEIWNGIVEGLSVANLAQRLQHRYSGDPASMESALETFLAELAEQGLVSESSAQGAREMGTTPAAPDLAEERTTFVAPRLATHMDMEGLLLLDPVHDVSEQGWPEIKAD